MKCTFCGYNIKTGTGLMYVKSDGKVFYFCSSKCEKNLLKFKRAPRNFKWTAEGGGNKQGKEIKNKEKENSTKR